MRCYDPQDEFDVQEAERLGAPQWMLELLENVNPSYPHWGPHEDYMWKKDSAGWEAPVFIDSWSEFSWRLDDMNECVHFYFSIDRDSRECPLCDGNGYNWNAQGIVSRFYAHQNEAGEHWNDKITQDEVQALFDAGRLKDFTRGKPEGYVPSAEEVNAAQRSSPGRAWMGHDAINRHILIETRLKRLGIAVKCNRCGGRGREFTSPNCRLVLVLWVIHPRKGASRGVEIRKVDEEDLPSVFEWLRRAAERNAERFARIPPKEAA